MAITQPCLDAVAHGGNPQDRAASLLKKLEERNLKYLGGVAKNAPKAHATRTEINYKK
ncbi:MAG: hypothetical protein F6K26_40755 [Moorea sp. SIO2I5]|nr:hypothetical protein [Moorena sp. SIO2I5]